ncbi:hypothetical protein [Hymenobacter daeguensis]
MPFSLPFFRRAPVLAPDSPLPAMRRFLAEIGLETEEKRLPKNTFLPGLLIDGGRLLIDPARLLYPGDVLHEAGHLAVTPAAERAQLSGNVMANKPEQQGTDGEEIAAMLWSYAAALALDIAPEVVFHPQGYRDQSAWILNNYRQGIYPGLPLLVWMDLTTTADFPRMTRWLRE